MNGFPRPSERTKRLWLMAERAAENHPHLYPNIRCMCAASEAADDDAMYHGADLDFTLPTDDGDDE